MAKYSKIKSQTIVGLYCNSSRRKLDSGVMKRHRGDRKRDKESEERCRRKSK